MTAKHIVYRSAVTGKFAENPDTTYGTETTRQEVEHVTALLAGDQK